MLYQLSYTRLKKHHKEHGRVLASHLSRRSGMSGKEFSNFGRISAIVWSQG